MHIAYFPKYTAQKSEPIWKAFLSSCKKFGIYPIENSLQADYALIWSVLWRGRMIYNKEIYEIYRSLNKPVFILEVGSLIRGVTWKVCVDNITQDGIYANEDGYIPNRDKALDITLEKYKINPNLPILITGQHDQSLQWTYRGTCNDFIIEKIQEVRKYNDGPIVIRPHPRNKIDRNFGKNTKIQIPSKILNTYDQYDINFNYRAIINYNSGIGIQAGINGTPLICHESSLANDISTNFLNLDTPISTNRQIWFEKILHSEWTVEEIAQGLPLTRLMNKLHLTK